MSVSHVIFYLHFILNVYCIFTLCLYVVIQFNGEIIWREIFVCIRFHSLKISFRYLNCCVLHVVMHFSSNCNKFLSAYSFGFFVSKYEGEIQDLCPFFR